MRRARLALAALLALLAIAGPAQAVGVSGLVDAELVHGDRDGDGYPEGSLDAQAPGGVPCLCDCPYLGGEVAAEAAGQRLLLGGVTVVPAFCGNAAWADADTARPSASAPPPSARVRPILPWSVDPADPGAFVARLVEP